MAGAACQRYKANLQKLLDDELSQDAALNQLLEIKAKLAKDTDSKQTKDSARGAERDAGFWL